MVEIVIPKHRPDFSSPLFFLLGVEQSGSKTVERGQVLSFELEFSLTEAVAELEIGIHIYDEGGRLAFSTNSTLLERSLLQVACGTHCVSYYLVADLPAGTYSAGFSFVEPRPAGVRELAWYDRLASFRVIIPRLTPGSGYVSLPVEFDCRQMNDTVFGLVENAAGTIDTTAVIGDVAVEESFVLPVHLKNASDQTWVNTSCNPINLTYRWLDLEGNAVVADGKRTHLPVLAVLPGQIITTQMEVVAPVLPGRFRLVLLPVQEMHCWFDDKGFAPLTLEMAVIARESAWRYLGADVRLFSMIGRYDGSALESTGEKGFLFFGPYAQLPAGRYVVQLFGRCEPGGEGVWVDVVCDKGANIIARLDLSAGATVGRIVELSFELTEPASDLEVRMWVTDEACVRVEEICISHAADNIAEIPEPLADNIAWPQLESDVKTPLEEIGQVVATTGAGHCRREFSGRIDWSGRVVTAKSPLEEISQFRAGDRR